MDQFLGSTPYEDYQFMRQVSGQEGGLRGGWKRMYERVSRGDLPRIGAEVPGAKPTFLFFGDSHGRSIAGAVDAVLKQAGIPGEAVAIGGVIPLAGYADTFNRQNEAIVEAVLTHLERSPHIRHVLLAGYWYQWQMRNPGVFRTAFRETIQRLQQNGRKLWVLKGVPTSAADIPRMLARMTPEEAYRQPWSPTVAQYFKENAVIEELAADYPPGLFIDTASSFLIEGSDNYRIEENGASLYMDSNHLSTRGAELIIQPLLERTLLPELVQSP